VHWQDEGIIVGVRRHGETSAIIELLTRHHGRHLGLVRGGRSKRMQPMLQMGNEVLAEWRARIEDHLGDYRLEAKTMRAAHLIDHPSALFALGHVCGLIRLLPEREPHHGLFDVLRIVLDALSDHRLAAPLVIRFEVHILTELGFGLDLTECALTGQREDLAFVSPNTGRAASRAAAQPWQVKLLALPAFLLQQETPLVMPEIHDIQNGFALTGHFLERHVYGPRGQQEPDTRRAFIASLLKTKNS
jgi:DNA repair protein RecO (recombination protein O)